MKRSRKLPLLMLLLVACSAIAIPLRNPFMPVAQPRCHAREQSQWRLLGIVAGQEKSAAWGISPQGKWVRLVEKQRISDSLWQVVKIEWPHVVLKLIKETVGCPSEMVLEL